MAASRSRGTAANKLLDASVINPAQLGGIETSVLDNGPGRGVRIAWVNTGGGLRYKVVIDRGLDVADAEFLGQSLTWHSLTGVTAPSHAYHHGLDWLGGFYGGLVVSCGPLNAGAPCEDQGQPLSLHGTHSNTPAILDAIVNPSPVDKRDEMSISGRVRTARVFGPNVELRRTIRSTLGQPALTIDDEFVNLGNETVEHAWLLHIATAVRSRHVPTAPPSSAIATSGGPPGRSANIVAPARPVPTSIRWQIAAGRWSAASSTRNAASALSSSTARSIFREWSTGSTGARTAPT